jgi:AhpC/TSA family
MVPHFLPLLVLPFLANPLDDAAGIELRYTGALSKAAQAAEDSPVKRFNLYAAVTAEPGAGRRIAFTVNERGAGGWPWPERFGSVVLDAQLNPGTSPGIRLLYDYDGTPVVIPLPLPISPFGGQFKTGARWNHGKETWNVIGTRKVNERDCWQVEVSTNIGRKRTLTIATETPLVVTLEERVFVGQGDEHVLVMQLESVQALDKAQVAQSTAALPALLKLQSDLQRAESETRPELTAAQLQVTSEALPGLQRAAADTPFNPLVTAIARDVKTQVQRGDDVSRLAEKFVGKAAPKFSLQLLDGSEVNAESWKSKITILHFWEYQGEPLVEPYGQVGYLDFLYAKRRKLGVQAYGIAVDARFGDQAANAVARKSIQKLRSFMNLGYPIAVDDGKLLERFGDPTRLGAKLPLWIVIGHGGTVAHFHTGFYKINPDDGLRELDELIVKLIRERKEAGDPADK